MEDSTSHSMAEMIRMVVQDREGPIELFEKNHPGQFMRERHPAERKDQRGAMTGIVTGVMLGVARIAAIQAAKRTSELIPLCHPLAITRISVDFELDAAAHAVECRAQVETSGQTGVEMEALTAASIGLLTIYDMCKAVDRGMRIERIRLVRKSGGKSGLIQLE